MVASKRKRRATCTSPARASRKLLFSSGSQAALSDLRRLESPLLCTKAVLFVIALLGWGWRALALMPDNEFAIYCCVMRLQCSHRMARFSASDDIQRGAVISVRVFRRARVPASLKRLVRELSGFISMRLHAGQKPWRSRSGFHLAPSPANCKRGLSMSSSVASPPCRCESAHERRGAPPPSIRCHAAFRCTENTELAMDLARQHLPAVVLGVRCRRMVVRSWRGGCSPRADGSRRSSCPVRPTWRPPVDLVDARRDAAGFWISI